MAAVAILDFHDSRNYFARSAMTVLYFLSYVAHLLCPPSVAYIANNWRTQRASVPKFGRKVP